MRRLAPSVLAVCVIVASQFGTASAGADPKTRVKLATFDSLQEGAAGTTVTDGGITFYGLERRIELDNPQFTIEQADGTLSGMRGFTPRNVLATGGYSEGPYLAFTRVGEFRISTGATAQEASVELYVVDPLGNVVTLEATRNGIVVESDSVAITGGGGVQHETLRIRKAQFDELRLVGSGAAHSGVFFGVIDTVIISEK